MKILQAKEAADWEDLLYTINMIDVLNKTSTIFLQDIGSSENIEFDFKQLEEQLSSFHLLIGDLLTSLGNDVEEMQQESFK